MTRSMPPECHQVGLRIKRRCPSVKWIASFGDPIAENPYEQMAGTLCSIDSMKNRVNRNRALRFRLSPRRILRLSVWQLRHARERKRQRELSRIEEQTLRGADRLIFNNESQRRYMLKSGDAEVKSLLIPHCYDEALFASLPAAPAHRRLRFVYVGQLNAIRSAMPLLRAIARLRQSVNDLAERAEFLFFGTMPDAELAYLVREDLLDTVRFGGPISYKQSLCESAAADWLIHLDGDISPAADENVFFAGKIADCFGAGKPILAVTMPRGAAADSLRRAGALVLSFSVNEIKQALYQIIFRGWRPTLDRDYMHCFSSSEAAKILDEQAVIPLLES